MKPYYPIIIIGAGPAGSVAASAAVKSGVETLLIERDNYPGEHSMCGGMAAAAFEKSLSLPEHVIDRRIFHTVLTFSGRTRTFPGRRAAYISFQRSIFDRYLAEQARTNGAHLATSLKVVAVDPFFHSLLTRDLRTGEERKVAASIIIFADGPKTLAQTFFSIGYRPTERIIRSIFVELAGSWGDSQTMEFIVPAHEETTGYYWIFPKRDSISVGIGAQTLDIRTSLKDRLSDFITSRSDLSGRAIVKKGGGLIPYGLAEKLTHTGALVVGDAAGLVNPLTGGGIAYAVFSGNLAGFVAAEAIRTGKKDAIFLQRYERRLKYSPHYAWLQMMLILCAMIDNKEGDARIQSYARILKNYFLFFNHLRPLAETILHRSD